jgi:hypothetical protein
MGHLESFCMPVASVALRRRGVSACGEGRAERAGADKISGTRSLRCVNLLFGSCDELCTPRDSGPLCSISSPGDRSGASSAAREPRKRQPTRTCCGPPRPQPSSSP